MPGVGALAYDSRNRIVGTGGVPTRGYDPGNRKIWWKSSSGSTYVDFWLPNGEKLATFLLEETPVYDVNNTYFLGYVQLRATQRELYFAGRRVATQWGNTNSFTWLQPDRLSSNARHHPYGEERGTSSTEYKFATYQREASGLDYALNRYYSSVYGRFLSSDPYRASGGPSDPGSWNRYAYVQGDPMNKFDPEGLATCSATAFSFVNGAATAQVYCRSNGQTIGGYGVMDVPWGNPQDPAYYAYVVAMAVATFGADLDREEEASALDCGVDLLDQPAVISAGANPVKHTLLRVERNGATKLFLEGGPVAKNPAKANPLTDEFWLNGFRTTGTSHYPGATSLVQSWLLRDEDCVRLLGVAEGYKDNTVTYNNRNPFNGPNSNSWVHSLMKKLDLSLLVALPNALYPGWSNTNVPF